MTRLSGFFQGAPPRRFPRGEVLVSSSTDRFAREAAGWLVERRRALAAATGSLPVTALSGGGTPLPVYRELAEWAATEPQALSGTWIQVDERDVPANHPDSNQGMIGQALLAGAPPDLRWVPIPVGERDDPHRVVAIYERELRACRRGHSSPADLALLGLGPDGHTASLFPGTAWADAREGGPWCAWYAVEALGTRRFTLTLSALTAVPHLVFLVTGAGKGPLLARILAGGADHLPAAALAARRPPVWLLDPAAAAGLST